MAIHTPDGQTFDSELDFSLKPFVKEPSLDQKFDELSNDPAFTTPTDPSGNPLKSPEKAPDALKPEKGTEVPADFTDKLKRIGSYLVTDSPFAKVAYEFYNGVKNLSTMGHDAYFDGMTEDQMIEKAASAASVLMGGGIATAGAKPGLGMFGGRMTKPLVNQAERLEAAGYSEQAIKEMTGLERGADNMWRKEFSDSQAKLTPEGFSFRTKDNEAAGFLKDVLYHPELYRVYPEAADIPVFVNPNLAKQGYSGLYNDNTKTIEINPNASVSNIRETLLHEIQHWVQNTEGFHANTPGQVHPTIKDFVKRDFLINEAKPNLRKIANLLEAGKIYEARLKAALLLKDSEREIYRRLASEVEARNVSDRSKMSAEQIKNSLAKHTEDYLREKQLVGKDGMMHVGPPPK